MSIEGEAMQPNVVEIKPEEGAEFNEVVGLCLTRSKGISMELARVEWEGSIRRLLTDAQLKNEPFITITLNCGHKVVYQTFEDIPSEDVPCPCGNPKHWMVKLTEIE